MGFPPAIRLNFRAEQKMKFDLKIVKITACSDDGLSLQPNPNNSRLHPVFLIEVFLLRLSQSKC